MAIIKVITPSVTDANITTAKVTDNAITLAKMASGTDGNIISYDASGNPVAVATGNDGQVLTSTGAGSPPAFEALPSSGKVLQVVSVTKIGAFTATNLGGGAIIDITGVAANITPSSTSSKILISYSVQGVSEAASRVVNFATTLKRGGSEITAAIAEAAGNRIRVANFISIRANANDQNVGASLYNTYLDSPSSTSQTTYQICLKNIQSTALTYHVNRTYGDANSDNYRPRGTSTITLMEIAG